MAIVRFDVRDQWDNNGLRAFEMGRLGPRVVLAGANGAGKSRVLAALMACLEHHASDEQIGLYNEIAQIDVAITRRRAAGQPVEVQLQQRSALQKRLAPIEFVEWDQAGRTIPIKFTPSLGITNDPDQLPANAVRHAGENFARNGADEWPATTLSYISHHYRRFVAANSLVTSMSDNERASAIDKFHSLELQISSLLGTPLTFIDDKPALFGRPVLEARLSGGQTVMLQLAVALHAYGSNLNGAVLLMDEPENHLHPAVLIKFFDLLAAAAPGVQVWIATHSVPLVAYFASKDPTCLWAMRDGGGQYAGKNPEEVLQALLGGEEGICTVSSFLSLPFKLASNNFAYQCLFPPEVVMTGVNDKQLGQIRQRLQSLRNGGTLRVLDFGAGKGRLVQAIGADVTLPKDHIDYVAFDPCSDDSAICKASIVGVFGEAEGRYFNDLKELEARAEKFDVVVMTNVLHEIDPAEWVDQLQSVARLLTDDGALLVVEDQRLAVGEIAHERGFMVLNPDGLGVLFDCKESEDALLIDTASEQNGRLTATLVPGKFVGRINSTCVVAALKHMRQVAMSGIRRIRKSGDREYRHGLEHALYTQLLANAALALEDLG